MLRLLTVWTVSTLTMLLLAGGLPEFRLQSDDGDSVTRLALTAAVCAGGFGLLSTLVWPLIVRALLLVPALVLGLLVFFLNGSLLWLALRIIPGPGEVDPRTAVVVAAVMSAASSAAHTFLAVWDDSAYRRRFARLAVRRRRRTDEAAHRGRTAEAPGLVFLQLDGIGHDVLREATEGAEPLMPTIAAMRATSHRLTPWRTDWSSQTGASQLGILHGTNIDVPAFRWYEKERGAVLVTNRPSGAAELERRAVARTGTHGLLGPYGASRGNLFSGGARQLALVLSVSARRGKETRSRAGYFTYFSDPANATRTAVGYFAEVFREIWQSSRALLRGDTPRVRRGGRYPFLRAFATVVQRDVVVAAVIGDLLSGRSAVYADLVAYDEVAHHSGPRSRDTHQVLRRLDRAVRLVAKAADYAPRPYRLVLLSDHGQSEGRTFSGRYGLTLEELVRAGCGLPVSRRVRNQELAQIRTARPKRSGSGAEAREAARAALHRPEERSTDPPPRKAPGGTDPVVLASGNLALVSFPDVPGRMSQERIEARHPALLRALANHPGVGFVLVWSERHGSVVLGSEGSEHHLDTGVTIGPHDPFAPFEPGAAAAVRRTAGFQNHLPDIMVNSSVCPETGAVHAFEEQVGSHGGLGGEQSWAFLLSPRQLSAPVPSSAEEGELIGAEQVHLVLRRWIRETGSPPVSVRGDSARTGG